jgi:flagellar biosynthesis GTPase FlhF
MSKKVYTTSNVQQLIDLNEDLTNFKLKFTLSSKNGKEFDMVIADQYTIDNTPNDLDFKRVKNTISGTIVSDKNVFQNHFLILKSVGENPAEVEVIINKKEISPNPDSQTEERKQPNNNNSHEENQTPLERDTGDRKQYQTRDEMREQTRDEMREQTRDEMREQIRHQLKQEDQENFSNKKESTTWIDIKLIIIIFICILAGIFIYNIMSKKTGITTDLGITGVNNAVSTGVNNNVSSNNVTGGNGFGNILNSGLDQNLFRKLNNSIPT